MLHLKIISMLKVVVIDAKYADGKEMKLEDGVYSNGNLQKKLEKIGENNKISQIFPVANNKYLVIYETS